VDGAGGVNAPLDPHAHEKTLAELPAAQAIVRRTIELWKRTLDQFPEETASFSNFPTMYLGLVGPDGRCASTTATSASSLPRTDGGGPGPPG